MGNDDGSANLVLAPTDGATHTNGPVARILENAAQCAERFNVRSAGGKRCSLRTISIFRGRM
jgi:hypothetical protein